MRVWGYSFVFQHITYAHAKASVVFSYLIGLQSKPLVLV